MKKRFFLFIPLSILAAGFFIYWSQRELCRCAFIDWADDFQRTDEKIYISKDTPDALRDSILVLIRESEARVCKFWEMEKQARKPTLIYCFSERQLLQYSKQNTMITYKSPLGCFIVFGVGREKIDMISHEMMHAELLFRIGYLNNARNIPVWFDEGLAMQADYRNEYSEEYYQTYKDSIEQSVTLNQIKTVRTFWSGRFYWHYLLAKHEVAEWLAISGKEGLFDLIQSVQDHEDFNAAYSRSRIKQDFVPPESKRIHSLIDIE